MKRKHARIFSADRLEPTSNNVIIRFKAVNLKRIHSYSLEEARKDYEIMINSKSNNLTKRFSCQDSPRSRD